MEENERKREIREQNALDRLGTNNPRCATCGEGDWRVLERHHIAGRKHDDFTCILCRNCHRKQSDSQKDHPQQVGNPPSPDEHLAHSLYGLADLLVALAGWLKSLAANLMNRVSSSTAGEV